MGRRTLQIQAYAVKHNGHNNYVTIAVALPFSLRERLNSIFMSTCFVCVARVSGLAAEIPTPGPVSALLVVDYNQRAKLRWATIS